MSSSNEILVRGAGKGNPSISKVRKYAVIDAVLSIVLCLIIAVFLRSAINQEITELNAVKPTISVGFSSIANSRFESAKKEVAELKKAKAAITYGLSAFGIGCVILVLYIMGFVSKRIESTWINVYEDKVNGAAVDRDFSIAKLMFYAMGWNKAKLTGFDLAINQITSIDLDGSDSIIINASGSNYKCFVSNGLEIQGIINNKIRNK